MKRSIFNFICLILATTFCPVAWAAQPPIAGEWTGGYETRGNYTPVKTRFQRMGDGVGGTLDFVAPREITGVVLSQVRFLSRDFHFELMREGREPLIFDGQLTRNLISGIVQSSGERGTFQLIRSVTPDGKLLDQFVGDYQIGPDSYVSIWRPPAGEPSAGIMYTTYDRLSPDHRSGNLFPISQTDFVAGPARWVPYPTEIRASFARNERGQVTLKWKPSGSPEAIGRKFIPHLSGEEEVKFSNGEVTLAGTLSVPVTKGRHPAIVLIHGSSGGERWRGGLPRFFAQNGIATLTYDKRGFGASSGTIAGATVNDMAGDAAAGIRLLQSRPDIDARKVGVWAISQGGWMAPVVAAMNPDLAFIVLHAGPAVSPRVQARQELENTLPTLGFTSEEVKEAVIYQDLALDAYRSDEAYGKYLAAYGQAKARNARWVWKPRTKEQMLTQWIRLNVDFDPLPFLEKLKVPIIAFFGEKDVLVPPGGNAAIMEAALEKAGNKDVTIRILPGVNHQFQLPGVGPDGFQTSGKTPPGYYDVMIDWLRKRLDLR